jgi:phage terminase small subunit
VTSSAAKLYNLPKVKAEIERRRRALAEENMIDSKQIVNRLSKMFNGELSSQFVTKKGDLIDVPHLYLRILFASFKYFPCCSLVNDFYR